MKSEVNLLEVPVGREDREIPEEKKKNPVNMFGFKILFVFFQRLLGLRRFIIPYPWSWQALLRMK